MPISINEEFHSSECFSEDDTLIKSITNLHLGPDQACYRNFSTPFAEDFRTYDGFPLNPISEFQKAELFKGDCDHWRCNDEEECCGVGYGYKLKSMRECVDLDGSFSPPNSGLCNSKKSCVYDRWECDSQEKGCFFENGGMNSDIYGQWPGVSVTLEDESVRQCIERNEVLHIASSKEGSQYLQNMLAMGDEEVMNIVFDGVYNNVYEVMMDPYGQHLFQKIFDVCSVSQQEKLVHKMVSDGTALIRAAKSQYGSHSLQKTVKKLKGSGFVKHIAKTLSLDMKSLMISQCGKHVIQQFFIVLDSQKCQVLYEALLDCCFQLATDIVGCTALNISINNIQGPYRDRLLSILVENSTFLSQDPSGNFVLQYILSLRNPTLSKKICSHLQGQFIHLSLNKSSSHLVEKCLRSQGMEYVITDLLANQKQLLQLARDQFGNYVLQTALKVSKCRDPKMHQFLLQALEPHVPRIKYHPIGRNVFNVITFCVPFPPLSGQENLT